MPSSSSSAEILAEVTATKTQATTATATEKISAFMTDITKIIDYEE